MAKHRTHSIEFKRQVVQEFLGGESLHDFPVRMSQLEHVGGRAHGCRDDSIDCDAGVRCRFCVGPLGRQARPLRRYEIEEGTVSDFASAPEPGVLVGHDAP